MNGEAGKGDTYRPVNQQVYAANYDAIFRRSPAPRPATSREDLAWVAGVFCGEGHVSSRVRPKYRTIRLCVAQSGEAEPEMLTRIVRIMGYGKVYRRKPHGKEIKVPWSYELASFEKVQAFIASIWQWLTPEKQRQATVALNNYHTFAPSQFHMRIKRFDKPEPDGIVDEGEEAYKEHTNPYGGMTND